MKVLYVVGACLTRNTSANMSHNGYVQGLLENGCEVDILMARDSWGQEDKGLHEWKDATYYVYNSETFFSRLRKKFSHANKPLVSQISSERRGENVSQKLAIKQLIRENLKKIFYALFPVDPLYPLEKSWLSNAGSFKSKKHYDLIISNSSPSASHKLVEGLILNKRVTYSRWIQIWEDPWYYDLYGRHSDNIKNEEHRLLQVASEVYYVSPLTLYYQKKLYPDCAHKLKYVPLPALRYESDVIKYVDKDYFTFGYFGDYYSATRNLKPFYEALLQSGNRGNIYGDNDLGLESTSKIVVKGRVTLNELSNIQANTDILVHLCNLKGGQIPGKIYHYSVTQKPILFILDGTPTEIEILRKHFLKYNRYFFCDNDVTSITNCMKEILAAIQRIKKFNIVNDFLPVNVVKQIL